MLPRACGTPRSQRAGWTELEVGGGVGSKHGDGASVGGMGRAAERRTHSVPPTPEDGEHGARCALFPTVLGPSLSASRGPLTTPNCSEVSPQQALSQDDPSPAGAGVASLFTDKLPPGREWGVPDACGVPCFHRKLPRPPPRGRATHSGQEARPPAAAPRRGPSPELPASSEHT